MMRMMMREEMEHIESEELSDEEINSEEHKSRRHEVMMMREHFMMMCEHEGFPFMPEMMFMFDEEEMLLGMKIRPQAVIKSEVIYHKPLPITPIVRKRNRPKRHVSQFK